MLLRLPLAATNATLGAALDATPPAFQNRSIEDMTLRDHYAGLFMIQLLNAGAQKGDAPLAQMAVKRADALMIELERSEPWLRALLHRAKPAAPSSPSSSPR